MFRHGQWVVFRTHKPFGGIHQTPNGLYLGVFQRGGKDALGNTTSACIFPVGPDGHNVSIFVGGTTFTLRFGIGEVLDAAPCVEADWLPESRRSHLPAGAKLSA